MLSNPISDLFSPEKRKLALQRQAKMAAEHRCECVLNKHPEDNDGFINELTERYMKLLERSKRHGGGIGTIYDEAEMLFLPKLIIPYRQSTRECPVKQNKNKYQCHIIIKRGI